MLSKNFKNLIKVYFSPGPLRSRAAKAIGFIDDMINYSTANAPLQKELDAGEHTISIYVLIILPWLLHS